MKKLLILIIGLIFTINMYSQSYAVAVNDTVECRLGETVTVNVLQNDYHVDGLSFKIEPDIYSSNNTILTDSTVIFKARYDDYYNYTEFKPNNICACYVVVDENGNWDDYSIGLLIIKLTNNYFDTINRNNIAAPVTCYGNHFWRGVYYGYPEYSYDTNFYFEYPKGSKKRAIFNSNFFIGGIDEQEQFRVSGEKYRQGRFSFWSGPINSNNDSLYVDTTTVCDWSRVWKLNVEDVNYHINNFKHPDYILNKTIETWPAHGDVSVGQQEYIAPFVDVDGDGEYHPLNGDYPLIKGDQCIFFVFNDLRYHNRDVTDGLPIGIEVHGMVYQFEEPGNENTAINNTTFLSYKIFNRSNYTLSNTYVGIYSDTDLGSCKDDYIGCDVKRGMYFSYNGEEIDGNGQPYAYGENPPAVGVVFLGGPYTDNNNLDDPYGGCDESVNGAGFGDYVIDNERYGLTGFVYYNNGGSQNCCEPEFAHEYYNYLSGYWRDSTHLQYGGNAHLSNYAYGPECRFMYPGLSDPCNWGTNGIAPNGPVNWTEENAFNGNPNWPGDRRGLGSSGPFTFKPGDVQKIDIAYVVARGDDGPLSSVELLREYVDTIRGRFAQDTDDFGTQYLGTEEINDEKYTLEVYPNPVNDILTVKINDNNGDAVFELYDIFGRRIIQKDIFQSQTELNIDMSNIPPGVYIATVKSSEKSVSAKVIKK